MCHSGQIWIIDDHQLFSAGMKQMLASLKGDLQILCFNNPEDTKKNLIDLPVQLIIIDYFIPGADAIFWIGYFSKMYIDTDLIVVSSSVSPSDKKRCLDAGATAYYEKHLPPDIVLENIKCLLEKKITYAKTASNSLDNNFELTSRQVDILIHLARGHSNKKIADLLNVSPETVKSHISSIYRTIKCNNRDMAISWARFHGYF